MVGQGPLPALHADWCTGFGLQSHEQTPGDHGALHWCAAPGHSAARAAHPLWPAEYYGDLSGASYYSVAVVPKEFCTDGVTMSSLRVRGLLTGGGC